MINKNKNKWVSHPNFPYQFQSLSAEMFHVEVRLILLTVNKIKLILFIVCNIMIVSTW